MGWRHFAEPYVLKLKYLLIWNISNTCFSFDLEASFKDKRKFDNGATSKFLHFKREKKQWMTNTKVTNINSRLAKNIYVYSIYKLFLLLLLLCLLLQIFYFMPMTLNKAGIKRKKYSSFPCSILKSLWMQPFWN